MPSHCQVRLAGNYFAYDAVFLVVLVGRVWRYPYVVGQYLQQVVVVGIYEDSRVFLRCKKLIQFAFSPDNTFQRAEALQVSQSHVSYYAVVGLGSLSQRLYVSRMACSHFNYCNLMLLVHPEQRFRHSHVVVEVALRSQYVVFLSQHRGYEFLSRSLSVSAGNADDWNVELPSVLACQSLVGLQRVAYKYISLVVFLHIFTVVNHSV